MLCFSRCLSVKSNIVSKVLKLELITPLIKKPDLDSADTRSYRPISNLSIVSKLLRILFSFGSIQFSVHGRPSAATAACISVTSLYRDGRAESITDLLYAVDDGDLSVLALLDPSFTFDAVNHDILLTSFRVSFGISDAVLDWFQSILDEQGGQCALRFGSVDRKIVLFGVP